MKKVLVFLFSLFFLGSSVAFALSIPQLPMGPLYIKFDNREQLSVSGSIVAPSGASESNWGIFNVTTFTAGDISDNPQNFDPAAGPVLWSSGNNNGYITGVFAGIQAYSAEGGIFNSTGGQIHFYYNEYDLADAPNLAASTPDLRYANGNTDDFYYPGFTDGVFLGALEFIPGVTSDPNVTITGTAIPTTGSFSGLANSYGNVLDYNNDGIIDSSDGVWAPYLGSQYFVTLLGLADAKFRTIYEGPLASWNGPANTDIIGAQSTDPARMYVVPEPSTMLLLGAGLLGLAAIGRKRFMQNG